MSATQKLLRFGVFELNLDTEELRKSGTLIKLAPQPFRLLALLASHSGQVVSRDEIQKQLWGEETFVDFEHGMNKCIKQIRNVLGDDADKPLYIETLPRQGYRFIPPVVSKVIAAPLPQVVQSASGERVRVSLLGASPAGGHALTAAAPNLPVAPPESVAAPEPEVAHVGEPRSRVRRVRLFWAAVVLTLVALIGGGFYWRAHRRPVLTVKDTIVLADFDNSTHNSVFDVSLRRGLSAQLEQSPFLNLLSDQRIAQTLDLMRQAKDARLTPELAREVCIRTGSAATVEGAIATLGKDYALRLRAVNCHSNDEIAVEEFTVDTKEKIVPALGKAASGIRSKLGESLASVQKYDAPAGNVTTASLEALQAYSLGNQALMKTDFGAAIPLLQRAISLDPNFAMAYALLATCYWNQGLNGRAKETMRKAYDLRERLSEREKLFIVSRFDDFVTGDLEAARRAYELWAQIYPHDSSPIASLGAVYYTLGNFDRALWADREALRLDPASGMNYARIIAILICLNRFEDAESTAREAQTHNLDNPAIHLLLYTIDFVRHDAAGMEHETTTLVGSPGVEDILLENQSDTAAYAGQFFKARELTHRAADVARRAQEKEAAAGYEAEAAVREALVGNMTLARQQAHAAIALSNDRDVEAGAAVALGLGGDSVQATRLADDLAKRYPQDTIMQFELLPMIRAAAVLGTGQEPKSAEKAVGMLTASSRYELGHLCQWLGFDVYPVYLRAQGSLEAHQGTAAAAEFRKILDHSGAVQNEPIGALAHLGLGRAYALSGDTATAKAAYQDFLTLWKDVDPDIPIYQQAKAEYAKLQ